jgi:hypothetical protein
MALPTTPEFTSTGTQSVVYAPTAEGATKITSGGGSLANLQAQIAQASGAPGSNLNYTANGSPQPSSGGSGVTSSPGASFGDQLAQGIGTVLGLIGAVNGAVAAVRTIGAGIQATIGTIKAAAGQVGDSVSKARAANLPENGEPQGGPNQINVLSSDDQDWRVRINADFDNIPSLAGSWTSNVLKTTGGVVFPYTPTVSINYKANYTTVEPIHSISTFQGFKNSVVEDITITGEFSVQNTSEADYWIIANQFFKTATKMHYGKSIPQGNPPIICQLSGFGNMILNNIPVVIKSYHVEMPNDVNYIQTSFNTKNQWVPALSTMTITVSPVYNRQSLRQFNLKEYASGKMVGFQ